VRTALFSVSVSVVVVSNTVSVLFRSVLIAPAPLKFFIDMIGFYSKISFRGCDVSVCPSPKVVVVNHQSFSFNPFVLAAGKMTNSIGCPDFKESKVLYRFDCS
jgi:hypothetical protein